MPYFLILLLYTAAFFGLLALAVMLFFTRFKSAVPYVLGAALGSVPGFVGANALLVLVVSLFLTGSEHAPPAADGPFSMLAGIATVGAFILVPLLVSAVGIGVGAVGGMYVAWRIVHNRHN